MPDAPAVQIRSLEKVYGTEGAATRALDGVDATFAAGELVAIMGPSGSGKSTLLHIVGALESPTGVLRALGSSRWLVRASLVGESLLLTLAGAIVGVLSGLVIGVAGISGLGDVLPGIVFRFPVGATVTVAVVAVVAVVLGSLAAVLSARRAARVDVIRALTYE